MWRPFASQSESRERRHWGRHPSSAREATPDRRQRSALNAVSDQLAEALAASPYAVYFRRGAAFEAAVVHGIEDAPTFAVEGSLPRALRHAGGPVMTVRSHRARLLDAALDPEDRGSLRRAGAIALVPLDRDLESFLLVSGPIASFDPERLARALVPVSACLRIARDGAPGPGSELRLAH